MQDMTIMDSMVPVKNGTANKRNAAQSGKKFEQVFESKQKSGREPVEAKTATESRTEVRDSSKSGTDIRTEDQGNSKTAGKDRTSETAVQARDEAATQSSDNSVASGGQKQSITGGEQPQEAGADSATEMLAGAVSAEPQSESNPRNKLQHTLMDLVKVVKGADGMTDEEAAEKISSLLADLADQLQGTDLHGEEVLAGIDLSHLADQFNQLNDSGDRDELLAELVASIQQQLAQPGLTAETVSPAGTGETPVVNAETVAAARKILQNVFDNTQNTKEGQNPLTSSVADDEAITGAEAKAFNEAGEKVDPRFAGLIGPRQDARSQNRQGVDMPQAKGMQAQQDPGQVTTDETVADEIVETLTTEGKQSHREGFNLSQLLGQGNRHNADNLSHPGAHGNGQLQGVEPGRMTMPQGQVVQLSSGQQVAESQIFDQVVTHLSGSFNGESGRMVLRLNPAELGSLKLDLVVEGDQIKANIHAQSQQVQEVLERNLPQLRHALAEQGLKIEQFQVDVDKQQSEGQFGHLADQRQNHSGQQGSWQFEEAPEEDIIPLAHLIQNGGGGISLHV